MRARHLAGRATGRLRREVASWRAGRWPGRTGDFVGAPRRWSGAPTHLGPKVDAALERITARMQPEGVDPDYDLAFRSFDLLHFVLQVRWLIEDDRTDPLRMFLRNGAEAKASPEVNFNLQAYLARYPEKAASPGSPYLEWLKRGRAAGEIADPAPRLEKMAPVLGMTPSELVDTLGRTRTDLQERLRTGTLGAMIVRAAEVEPLVADAWSETTRPLIPPLVSPNVVEQVAAIHGCHEAAGHARAKLLLVVSDPRWGGGRRMEGHLTHALRDRVAPHEVVVIYTDTGGAAPPGRFPAGVREIDLAGRVEEMERPHAYRVLVELIRSFHADCVVNVNSRLLYEAMATYGRALAASERLFLMMFCNEQLAMGNWVGVPLRFFYRTFDLVEGVITDSVDLADSLRERHQLGPEDARRIHVFRSPVDPGIPLVSAPPSDPGRRPQVYWAGRWDRQKRMDIAFEIARRMPEADFRMWGESVLTGAAGANPPDNVSLEGRYEHIKEIDLAQADAWLYTAGWDGVPSQLLEVGMTGIPLVASLVGGTGEVLHEDDSWPVSDIESPDAYVAALREVLADEEQARHRARALRERLLLERTEPALAAHAIDVLFAPDVPATSEEQDR